MTWLGYAVHVAVVALIVWAACHIGQDCGRAREKSSWLARHEEDQRQRRYDRLPKWKP
jgi:hypothetical protein